jgi:hypothetical protein
MDLTNKDFNFSIYSRLSQLLDVSGKTSIACAKFESLTDDNQRISFVQKLLEKYNLIPKFNDFKLNKDVEKAEFYRNAGNDLYRNRRFMEALEMYNRRYN